MDEEPVEISVNIEPTQEGHTPTTARHLCELRRSKDALESHPRPIAVLDRICIFIGLLFQRRVQSHERTLYSCPKNTYHYLYPILSPLLSKDRRISLTSKTARCFQTLLSLVSGPRGERPFCSGHCARAAMKIDIYHTHRRSFPRRNMLRCTLGCLPLTIADCSKLPWEQVPHNFHYRQLFDHHFCTFEIDI